MSDNITCGPLLRYTFIDYASGVWNGTLLIVVPDALEPSPLHLSYPAASQPHLSAPRNIFSAHGHDFWSYALVVQMRLAEQRVEYTIGNPHVRGSFSVPGRDQNMRIMFHSCNGFSVKIRLDRFAGPALWNDVLRTHAEYPFHVMIGGGDQVYSDGICVDGPLKAWADDPKLRHRARTPCTPELSHQVDEWYFNNYITWYNTSPFREACAVIPSIQIWDDHDIIDGYGSYQDPFMRSPVFLDIGKTAHKYYLLFQHHTPPFDIERALDPSFVLGSLPGPYIPSPSLSLCTNLGPRTVFFGLDGRVERTRTRVCYESTYDTMFSRLDTAVAKGHTRHVLVLLGVPIAYPRLVWLEGLLSNKWITTPMKWGYKLFGIGGNLFNKFDGSSELLDDLNDHWCAVSHKQERNKFVERLQDFARAKQVRITILSGDVHLGAVGRFFSAPRLKIPQNKDPRYMVNVISSAITNAPPPTAVARLIHRRNRVHILNWHTHENLMGLFREDNQGKPNKINTTMPARNYAIITEHAGLEAVRRSHENQNGIPYVGGNASLNNHPDLKIAKNETGGTTSENASAAAPHDGTKRPYALDIAFRVEVNPEDPQGKTKCYGFSIPAMEA